MLFPRHIATLYTSLSQLSEAGSNEDHKESVVGVWTRESSHNYENNARVTEEFVCPLASKFVVEFDSRCITERRYDYLEFTDVHGVKHRFDGKVNSDRWSQVRFDGAEVELVPSITTALHRQQSSLGQSCSSRSIQMAVTMSGATYLQ